jgi:hypothetical protein
MVINLSGAVNLAILRGQWGELNFTVMVPSRKEEYLNILLLCASGLILTDM